MEKLIPANIWYNVGDVVISFVEQPEVPGGKFPPKITAPPENVQKDQPLEVKFEWDQTGLIAGLDLSAVLSFKCEVFLEKMGTGADLDFAATEPYAIGDGHDYSCSLVIPANSLAKGVYRVTAAFKVVIGTWADTPIVGFEDVGLINVYIAN